MLRSFVPEQVIAPSGTQRPHACDVGLPVARAFQMCSAEPWGLTAGASPASTTTAYRSVLGLDVPGDMSEERDVVPLEACRPRGLAPA